MDHSSFSHNHTARRASSVMSRPRLKERIMTSSSTGAPQLQRRDSLPFRPRVHRDSTTSYRSYRSRRDSLNTDAMSFESDDDLSQEDEEWERGEIVSGGKKKRSRDEPMSPVMVVLYVIFFYIIWQILTRSDETEILGHLPLTHLQSLSSSLHSDLRPPSQYHLPYHLPQIPSPIPNTPAESTSTFRTVLGLIAYPVYLLITLVATPFPLLLNALHLFGSVLGTVLYPITATGRLLGRTLILAPLGVISSILAVFYPVYVFVAGVVGIGCVLGLGAGWIGKMALDLIFGSAKNKKASRRSVKGRGRSDKSQARSSTAGSQKSRSRKKTLSPSTEEEGEHIFTPEFKSIPIPVGHGDEEHVPYHMNDRKKQHRVSSSRAYDRDPAVVGIRRRGVRDSWSERQSTAW